MNKPLNAITKKDLYQIVESIRSKNGVDYSEIEENFHNYCSNFKGFDVLYHKFKTRAIRGLAIVDEKIIFLNPLRTDTEQNFDCAHEFFHVVLHKNSGHRTFNCCDYAHPKQDPYLEWQANEAGAELLIPYKKFIPEFVSAIQCCDDFCDYWNIIDSFATEYRVTHTVIRNRVDSLKYEIYQHEIKDIPVDKLIITSASKQKENGIFIPSYHDRFGTNKKAP